MSVYFKCKNCEAEHKSAVAFTDRVSQFGGYDLEGCGTRLAAPGS